jgi:hypothetical protein
MDALLLANPNMVFSIDDEIDIQKHIEGFIADVSSPVGETARDSYHEKRK